MISPVALPDLGVSLPVPQGWELGTVSTALGEPVVLAPAPWGPHLGFRPSLGLVGVDVGDAATTIHRAGTDALAVALAEQDSHLVSYDVWPDGRRLRRLAWVGGEQLVQEQWVVALADRVLTFTATVDAERWTVFGPVLGEIVAGAGIEGDAAPEQAYDRRWRRARSSGGAQEPSRDVDLVRLGENLEDLSRIAGHQRFRPSGVTLDRDPLVPWLRGEAAQGAAARELVDVGLVAGDGALTSAGHRIRTIVAEADRVLQIEAAVGLLPLTFSLYRRGGDAVVLCTDGVSQWRGAEPHRRALSDVPGRVHLMDLSTVGSVGVLCSWLGVGPAWSLDVEPATVDRDLLLGRVQDPRIRPPRGAGEQLRQVWSRIGALWTLRCVDGDGRAVQGLVGLDAADRGTYLISEVSDGEAGGGAGVGGPTVRLDPLPSAALLDEFLALVIDPVEQR